MGYRCGAVFAVFLWGTPVELGASPGPVVVLLAPAMGYSRGAPYMDATRSLEQQGFRAVSQDLDGYIFGVARGWAFDLVCVARSAEAVLIPLG